MGVEAADLSCWVLHSTEAELGDLLKSPNNRETPVTPKVLDRLVQVAADVFLMRSRIFILQRSSMAPFAMESDRVHLANSAGSVGAVVVPLTMSQKPTKRR